jgi:CRP-like cAMP-binding protein
MQALILPKKFRKGEFLLREGEVAKYGGFIARGCVRSYTVDNKGKEHIVQFSPEDWWVANIESMRTGAPSAYFIDAVEDTDVLLFDPPSFQKIIQNIPAFASLFQVGIQKHASAKDHRIIASLSASAEERYTDFLQKYPSIAQRVPQHMLASYLGVSPETLSRIRKQMSRKK